MIKSPLSTLKIFSTRNEENNPRTYLHVVRFLIHQNGIDQRKTANILLGTPVVPGIFAKVEVRKHSKLEGAVALERETRFAWIWVEVFRGMVLVQLELWFLLCSQFMESRIYWKNSRLEGAAKTFMHWTTRMASLVLESIFLIIRGWNSH